MGASAGVACGAVPGSALRSPAQPTLRRNGCELRAGLPAPSHGGSCRTSSQRSGREGPRTDSREKHRGAGQRPCCPASGAGGPLAPREGLRISSGQELDSARTPAPGSVGATASPSKNGSCSPSGFGSQKVLPIGGSDSDTCSCLSLLDSILLLITRYLRGKCLCVWVLRVEPRVTELQGALTFHFQNTSEHRFQLC